MSGTTSSSACYDSDEEVLLEEPHLILPLDDEVTLSGKMSVAPKTAQERYNDPEWKCFVTFWLRQARELHKNNSWPSLREKDRSLLEKQYDEVCRKALEYKQEADKLFWPFRTNYGTVHDTAKQIEFLVRAYLLLYRSSESKAQKAQAAMLLAEEREKQIAQLSHGAFKTFANMRRTECSFHSVLRFVAPASPTLHEEAFSAITAWLNNSYQNLNKQQGPSEKQGLDKNRIFWLQGDVQSGKSVVTNCFAKLCCKAGAFAGGYVFSERDSPKWLGRHFLATITVDLANLLGVDFKLSLEQECKKVTNDLDTFLEHSLDKQFTDLILPAYSNLDPMQQTPMLITLDDLHQCEETGSIGLVLDFLDATLDRGVKFPVFYLISSRPTAYVRWWMDKHGDGVTTASTAMPEWAEAPLGSAIPESSHHENKDVHSTSPRGSLALPRSFMASVAQYTPFTSLIPRIARGSMPPVLSNPRDSKPATEEASTRAQIDSDQEEVEALTRLIPDIQVTNHPLERNGGEKNARPQVLPPTSSKSPPSTSHSPHQRPPLQPRQSPVNPAHHLQPVVWNSQKHTDDGLSERDASTLMEGLLRLVREGGLPDQTL